MAPHSSQEKFGWPLRRLASTLFDGLASPRLAVVLLVLLAAVLAWATILESAHGRNFAQWHVYRSNGFIGLLSLLSANILAATLARFPWNRSQLSFVVTHAGLLVLLAGSIQTFRGGIEGRLSVTEGDTADAILLSQRTEITAHWQGSDGQRTIEFGFEGGPTSWSDGDVLDFGTADGIGVKVLMYHPRARRHVEWVAGESGSGTASLNFTLIAPGGKPVGERWLGGNVFGNEVVIAPSRFAMLPVSTATMLEDFIKPPAKDDMPEQGVLSLHYDGRIQRIPVGENLGKKVKLGESDLEVEIAEYLPNAKPRGGGGFASAGKEPKNPLLEIQVHTPERDGPIRQIAFARLPLLNLDGVHGWSCPVKLWYHHPAVTPTSGAEFLQTPDGKLYARAAIDGAYQVRGEVHQGDELEVGAGFKIVLRKYLRDAREEVSFEPVAAAAGGDELEAAALVEATADGVTHRAWLKRNDDHFGFSRMETPEGSLLLTLGYEYLPLGFSLSLEEFQREQNPGRVGNASFASVVRLVDEAAGIDEQRTIAMNEPLTHGKFTFYQSSFEEQPGGTTASVLSVACDPGRTLKYLGSLMICAGTFIMFYLRGRASGRIRFPRFGFRRRTVTAEMPVSQTPAASGSALGTPHINVSSISRNRVA